MRASIFALCLLGASSAALSVPRGSADLADVGPELQFGDAGPMRAHVMKDMADSLGAVCLDGSPGAFFFSPAADAANANNWQIYFQGGGWCYEEQDCWNRAKSHIGTSNWIQDNVTTSSLGGLLSSDCAQNPEFCKYNRVHMLYCDGNSFSGNREDPIVVNGQKIFFRGKRIIDATLRTLRRDHGLGAAENVLLTGCSAGGLGSSQKDSFHFFR